MLISRKNSNILINNPIGGSIDETLSSLNKFRVLISFNQLFPQFLPLLCISQRFCHKGKYAECFYKLFAKRGAVTPFRNKREDPRSASAPLLRGALIKLISNKSGNADDRVKT